MNVIIQGEVLNRETFATDPFLETCRTKKDFLKAVGQAYDSVKECDTLSVKILIRKGN